MGNRQPSDPRKNKDPRDRKQQETTTERAHTRYRPNAQKVSCGPVHAQAHEPCYTNLIQLLHSSPTRPTASPATLDRGFTIRREPHSMMTACDVILHELSYHEPGFGELLAILRWCQTGVVE